MDKPPQPDAHPVFGPCPDLANLRAYKEAIQSLDPSRFNSAKVLLALSRASRCLAEIKGVVSSMPNQAILINTFGLQEAKDSSEIENIITTHDELLRHAGLLTNNHIIAIQAELGANNAGFRKLPDTALRSSSGKTVYEPPQEPEVIVALMSDLERFGDDSTLSELDPVESSTCFIWSKKVC